MKELLTEKIKYSEFDEVSAMLTDAFETNPAYSIIFKNKNHLREGLMWIFKTSLLMNNQKQILTSVIKEKPTGKIIGTFTLIPPQGVKNSLSIYSKIGLFSFISKFGLKTFTRMLSLDNCNKTSLTKSIKATEYYYLSMVVIRKEYRGTGVGSYAIKDTIQNLISSNSTCRLMGLTTQLPKNVVFYSRLGFNLLDEGYIDFKGDQYYNYNMKLNL